ncbi:MAG: adenylate/guanylate cyclase domain-containing protein [Rhodospirillaceae bacterium]
MGALPYLLARKGIGGFGIIAAFMLLEAGVLSYILIVPMPFEIESWTPQMNLRLPGFLYLGVFLVSMGLSYSPALVIWAGAMSILTWTAGYLWVASLPETTFMWPLDLLHEGVTAEAFLDRYLDPHVVRPNFFLNQVTFLSAVTVVLALTVWRSRSLVHRVLSAEQQKADALAEHRFVREVFGKFVPDTVVKEILKDRGQLLPKKRLAPVLFADLEGFTALSKKLPPERLLTVLNAYFEAAGRLVTAQGGTITQFQGDALLASFNVPIDAPDHACDAVRAAKALIAMAETQTFAGEALQIRIGINTGEVVAGAVGGVDRLTYTVHGECVNIAARLEQLNKDKGTRILMTADTAERLGNQVDVVPVGAVDIRGIEGPVDLYSVG